MPRYHSNPSLKRLYTTYNRLWFGGKLQRNTILVYANIPDASADITQTEPPVIRIHRNFRTWGRLKRFSLLHEMAHLATDVSGHGPRWQREMRRLVRVGAFDRLW